MSNMEFYEEVTGDDLAEATADGAPVGVHRCIISNLEWIEMTRMSPACMGGKFKLVVKETLEVEKKPVAPGDEFKWQGSAIFCDIPMPVAGQKPFFKKIRLQAAFACGLIQMNGGNLDRLAWETTVGKEVLIKYEYGQKKGEDGKYVTTTDFKQVSNFGGWKPAGAPPEPEISEDEV